MRDSSGMSSFAAQAVDNINKGNTPYQRELEFKRRAMMAGIQAGIQGISGVMKGAQSESLAKDQRKAAADARTQAAIRNAKRPPPQPDDTPRDEYGLEVARPSYAGAMDNAVRGGMAAKAALPEDAWGPGGGIDTKQAAKDVQAQNNANDAAAQAPVNGQWTDQGFQDADANASVSAGDIMRAKQLMRGNSQFGGLANSFAGGY